MAGGVPQNTASPVSQQIVATGLFQGAADSVPMVNTAVQGVTGNQDFQLSSDQAMNLVTGMLSGGAQAPNAQAGGGQMDIGALVQPIMGALTGVLGGALGGGDQGGGIGSLLGGGSQGGGGGTDLIGGLIGGGQGGGGQMDIGSLVQPIMGLLTNVLGGALGGGDQGAGIGSLLGGGGQGGGFDMSMITNLLGDSMSTGAIGSLQGITTTNDQGKSVDVGQNGDITGLVSGGVGQLVQQLVKVLGPALVDVVAGALGADGIEIPSGVYDTVGNVAGGLVTNVSDTGLRAVGNVAQQGVAQASQQLTAAQQQQVAQTVQQQASAPALQSVQNAAGQGIGMKPTSTPSQSPTPNPSSK